MPVQHRHQHGDAVRVHAIRGTSRRRQHGFGDERLHFDGKTAMPIQCECHARALHRSGIGGIGRRQKKPRRVRHLFDAFAAHIETADLIGGAETILHRAQHAKRGFGIPFELADHIDEMFQRAWAGN